MTDRLTSEQRRRTMQAVKSADTGIERGLRAALWRRGLRYRKNYRKLLGKPDVVFVGPRIAVFCDSEFWHGYRWEERKHDIKSNRKFWFRKIARNIERDRLVTETLRKDGWLVLRFWGNKIERNVEACVVKIQEAVRLRSGR